MVTSAVADGKHVGTAVAVDITKEILRDVTKCPRKSGTEATTTMGDNKCMV